VDVPLDDERIWYRYHHLFADLLHNRLKRTQPNQVPALHRRASQWCEAHMLIAEAVGHALASGDMEKVARLVEENAFSVMGQGELTTVVGWLDALPDEVVRSRPWLSISYAWALMHTGQLGGVEPRLQDAEKASDGEEQNMEGYVAAMRAYVAACRGEIAQGIGFARQALNQLFEPDLMARSFTAALLSSLYRFKGDFVASTQAIAEAISISRQVGDGPMIVLASCNLAGTLILQGQLREAATTFRGVLRLVEDFAGQGAGRLPFTGLASTCLATVCREWNDLETAARLAREGVELSKQWGQAEVIMHGYVELAHVLQACGDGDGALDALQRAMHSAQDPSSWAIASLESTQARLHLAQGNLAAAAHWAQERGLTPEDEFGFERVADYLALAQVLIAQDRLDEASRLLTRLLNMAEPAGAMGYVIQILVLRAVAYQAQSAPDSALKSLAKALVLAEPEGYVRTFMDAGASMAALLPLAAAGGVVPQYVHELLPAFADSGLEEPDKAEVHNRQPEIIESLSERELAVLRLIAAGLSNRQIADELWLAVGTVKKHTNNIYGKLGVRNRVQAIVRAKELRLIPHQ
jgi:LuxR family maltose regulon positive regulatory protein